jgi:hypothetical protein
MIVEVFTLETNQGLINLDPTVFLKEISPWF